LCEGYIIGTWGALIAVPLWAVSGLIAAIVSRRLRQSWKPFLVAIPLSVIGGSVFVLSLEAGLGGPTNSTIVEFGRPALLAFAPVVLFYLLYARRRAA
jgi:hypothetical protein